MLQLHCEQLHYETVTEVDKVGYIFMSPDLKLKQRQLIELVERERKEVAVSGGDIVSAAKAYEGKKGQTCRRFYD